jgi:hypothetical protein
MPLDLYDLRDLGELPVRFDGPAQISGVTKRPCLWFEWDQGEPAAPGAGGDLFASSRGHMSEAELVVHTPKGDIELSHRSLRPRLTPSFDQTWSPGRAAGAPAPVRQELRAKRHPVRVVEYCLEAGRSYFARVEVETYMLPPGPDSDGPTEGHNAVLVVSDTTFVEGGPRAPLTPMFRQWSY